MNSPFQVGTDASKSVASPWDSPENQRFRRFIGWACVFYLAIALAGVNIILPSVLNDVDDNPLAGMLLGICIAEVNLIAIWGVMAPGRWLLRLPWSMALLVVMWYTLVIGARWENATSFQMEEAIHLGETLLLGYLAALFPLTIIAAIFKWRLERREDQEVREQMSIGLLLVVMTLLGVLLAMGRWVLPQDGFRMSMMDTQIFILLGAIILFNLLETTPAIWISFFPPGVAMASALGMIVYAVLLSVIEVLFISMFLGMPPDFWEIVLVFSSINAAQVGAILLVLAAMRMLGFQLVRKRAGNPFATASAAVPQVAPVVAVKQSPAPSSMSVEQLFKFSDEASGGEQAAPATRSDIDSAPPIQAVPTDASNTGDCETPVAARQPPADEHEALEAKVAAALRATRKDDAGAE